MKKILFFTLGLLLSFSAQSAVIYQSGAYEVHPNDSVFGYCSSCNFRPNQYVGATLSLGSAYSISSLDFYAQNRYSGSGDLTVAFYNAPDSLVYSQTFTLAEQAKTILDTYTVNISVNFNAFKLAPDNYAIFFFGQDLIVRGYDNFGSSLIYVDPDMGVLSSDPQPIPSSTAIRLSGELATVVPEPETFAFLLLGLGFLSVSSRKKFSQASQY